MGFLSGLFSDKKKVESNSNQTGQQSYGLSDEAKNYWSTVAPTFNQGWTPVANDPSQIAAAGAQAGLSSGLNPAFNTATGIGASGISTADIQRFQNPYEDQVVRDTLEDMRYADSQALSQSNAAAAKAGALGGTSGIVRRNLLEDNFQDARNKAVTGIRQAGFNTAADLAAKSTSAQLAGVGAASGIAGQQSGINQTQFGMGTQGWNQAWQNANQPFTVAGQGAQVLAGLSPASGQNTSGTSTGTQTTTASPSLFSVGANLLGAGFAGGWRPFAANGGRIEMADGGAVDGDAPQSQKDPHAKFKSAFDAISSMLERARGGSVSGMAPMRAGGGPVGSWSTTVTPASTFDNKAFGQSLSRMGESKGSGGDDTALLQQQQQALSSMLSGMSGRRAAGGGVWDETGPEFGGSSGIAPPARLGAAPERVERRPLAPPRSTWTGEDEVWQGLRAPQRAAAMGLLEADGRDPVAARNAISAMINRSNRTGEDLGDHVSRAIYQPTIEPAQRARLRSIVASPAFKEMTSFAEDRIYNRVPDPVGGNTHFLAHEPVMERLTAREPGKYRSWPGWTGYAKSGGQYSNPDGSPVIRDKSHAFLSPKGRFDGGDPSRDLEENPGPMPPPAPSSTMVASSSARGPVRMASVEPTSSSGAPIATDAPKRGGWFNEGVWTGEKVTPMQRLGIGLMSVRGPMFGGPMNDMAKQLMGMEEGRLNEKRIDSQADQFAKQLAQQADLAAGFAGGRPTIAAQQFEEQKRVHDADIKNKEALAAQLKLQTPEYRATVAEKFGLKPGTPDYQAFVLNGQLPAKAASGDQYKEIGGKLVRIPAAGGKPEVVFDGGPDFSKLPEFAMKSAAFASRMVDAEKNLREIIKPQQKDGKPVDPRLDPTSAGTGAVAAVPEWLGGNWLRSQPHQQYIQAAKQWIRAFLRKESGAAISDGEFEQDFKTYFPQPGDGPEVLAQKEAARVNAARGFAGETRGFFEHNSPDQAKVLSEWTKAAPNVPSAPSQSGAGAPASSAPPQTVEPPEGAIRLLRMQPNPKMIEFFEQKYGPGSARKYLEAPNG